MSAPSSPPQPRRVLDLEVSLGLPELSPARPGEIVMIVGRQQGVPVGSMTLALDDDPAVNRERLSPLRHLEAPHIAAPVSDDVLPPISIVVPTIATREEDLRRLVKGLTTLDYPHFEVVLVDNRKSAPKGDFLVGLQRDFPLIRIINQSIPGISAARNAGVTAARNDIIAFTDDDVRVDSRWLRAIGSRLVSDQKVDVVTGLILPAELETPAQIWLEQYYGGFGGERTFAPKTLQALPTLPRMLRGSRLVVHDESGAEVQRFAIYGVGAYAAGANMAFRRSALDRIHGFDVALGTGTPTRGGEDLAAIISILWTGGRLAFEPAAVVHHRHRRSLQELQAQLYGNGVGWSAYVTSLIMTDPRHLLALGWQIPRAIQQVSLDKVVRLFSRPERGQRAARLEGVSAASPTDDSYPLSLARYELRGLPLGPLAYLRSRRTYRRRYNLASTPIGTHASALS